MSKSLDALKAMLPPAPRKITVSGKHIETQTATLNFNEYGNRRTAMTLNDSNGPITTITVNLPDVPLGSDEVIIKDHSENEGLLPSLVAAGVVSEPLYRASSGFCTYAVCKLLIK